MWRMNMACCNICGIQDATLRVVRYWDSDDGWRVKSLCRSCRELYGKRKPAADDYAMNAPAEVLRASR